MLAARLVDISTPHCRPAGLLRRPLSDQQALLNSDCRRPRCQEATVLAAVLSSVPACRRAAVLIRRSR